MIVSVTLNVWFSVLASKFYIVWNSGKVLKVDGTSVLTNSSVQLSKEFLTR